MKRRAAVCLAAIACTASLSLHAELLIDTPLEPAHLSTSDTLQDAARRNDFAAFETMYASSPDAARWRAVHDVWTYAQTERTGAFFGSAMHDALAAQFPGFAEYIGDYAITDSNGAQWYPSAETRAYLLAHVGEARDAAAPPRVVHVARAHHVRRSVPAAAPAPAPLPVVITTPVSVTPAPPAIVATPKAAPAPQSSSKSDDRAPAILLIVAALAGIAAMSLLLRTPAETTITPAAAAAAEPPPTTEEQPPVKTAAS